MGEWSEFQENGKRALDNEPRNVSIWFSCCYLVAFRLLQIHFWKGQCVVGLEWRRVRGSIMGMNRQCMRQGPSSPCSSVKVLPKRTEQYYLVP